MNPPPPSVWRVQLNGAPSARNGPTVTYVPSLEGVRAYQQRGNVKLVTQYVDIEAAKEQVRAATEQATKELTEMVAKRGRALAQIYKVLKNMAENGPFPESDLEYIRQIIGESGMGFKKDA